MGERDVTCSPAFPLATLFPLASSPLCRWRGPGLSPGLRAVPPPAPCSLPAVLLNTMEADFPVNQVPC